MVIDSCKNNDGKLIEDTGSKNKSVAVELKPCWSLWKYLSIFEIPLIDDNGNKLFGSKDLVFSFSLGTEDYVNYKFLSFKYGARSLEDIYEYELNANDLYGSSYE